MLVPRSLLYLPRSSVLLVSAYRPSSTSSSVRPQPQAGTPLRAARMQPNNCPSRTA